MPRSSHTKAILPYSGFFKTNIEQAASISYETSVHEMFLKESLLSPNLETSIRVQSTIHNPIVKNYDLYKGAQLEIEAFNPNIMSGSEPYILYVKQPIYRMDNRNQDNYNLETFTLNACHHTLLTNHGTKVSQFFKCQTPSIVAGVALNAAGATITDVETSGPARDYQAANLHPYQILAEQADVALAGIDPSFIHYMTYLNNGTHHFRSLKTLTKASSKWSYVYSEKGFGSQLGDAHNIMKYDFPCDFDLLSDIINGVGDKSASTIVINPFKGIVSLLGGVVGAFNGLGSALTNSAITTEGGNDDNCGTSVEDYMSLRQARISLIQSDMISLRLIVPFNPLVHAGDMIDVTFIDKIANRKDYGSGDYLIVNLIHNIKAGGMGMTTLDCVSRSVGNGVV